MRVIIILLFIATGCTQGQQGFLGIRLNTLHESFKPEAGVLIIPNVPGTWKANQGIEPTFFYDSSTSNIKIYYTGSQDSAGQPALNNRIGLSTTTDFSTLSDNAGNPLIGQGAGGATSNRRAHSSWVGKIGNTYYAMATNGYGSDYAGEDRNIYGYTSTDGITWTDRGIVVNKATAYSSPVIGFGNTGVVTDQYNNPVVIGGKYVAIIEIRTGAIWESFRAEADSLMGQWTITTKLLDLAVVEGSVFGGAQVVYVDGVYHTWYQYGTVPVSNIPTFLSYATSTDCIHWTIKEAPFMGIEVTPFDNTDQIADPCIIEANGKVYMLAEYVQNSPTYYGQIRVWSYNGTFRQLIASLY